MYLLQFLALLLLSAVALGQAPADFSPPGLTLPGTASNCNRWYKVKKGDTCDSVQKSVGITAKDFFALNPDVSADCLKNFWLDQAYCVGVGPGSPSSSSTLGPSVSVPSVPSSSSSVPPIRSSASFSHSPSSSPSPPSGGSSYTFNHPITSQTLIPPSSTAAAWPPTKTHPGQPATCNKWHLVKYGETCSKIKALYSTLTMDDLLKWNPDLAADCDLPFADWWVCVGVKPESSFTFNFPTGPVSLPETTPWTPTSLSRWSYSSGATPTDSDNDLPSTVTAMPTSRVQANTTKDCRAWYQVNDWETCKDVVDLFGTFSVKEFVAWNPTVGGDCAGIQDHYFYCVAVPGTPANRTAPPPPEVFPTAIPRQPGVASNCNHWWRVGAKEDCDLIARANGISLDDFQKWNPAITFPDCRNLIRDTEVCVGVSNGNGTSTAPPLPPYPTGRNHTNHSTMPRTSRFPPRLTSTSSSQPGTWWTRPTGFTTSYGKPASMPCSNTSSTSHQGWTSTDIEMTLPWTSTSVVTTKHTLTTPCDESTSTDVKVTLPWTSAPVGTPIRHTLSTSSSQEWTSSGGDMTLPWTSASAVTSKHTSNVPCDESTSTDIVVTLPWTSLSAVPPTWHPPSSSHEHWTSAPLVTNNSPTSSTPCEDETDTEVDLLPWISAPTVTSHSHLSSTPCDDESSTSHDGTAPWSTAPTSSPILTPTMAMTTPCVHTVTTTTTIICDTKVGS